METKTQPEVYRDYLVLEVFRYRSGKSDWEVYRGDQEHGTAYRAKTRAEVLASIDEMVEENIIN